MIADLAPVIFHRGNPLAAIKGGRCIDTTMGFTSLVGLVMATRSDNMDPGMLLGLMREGVQRRPDGPDSAEGIWPEGLSGLSGDMREIREAAGEGHNGAIEALEMFRHRLQQLLGSMAGTLRRVDVLALTGGISEHDKALQS